MTILTSPKGSTESADYFKSGLSRGAKNTFHRRDESAIRLATDIQETDMSKNLDKQTFTVGIVASVVAAVLPTLSLAVASVSSLVA